MTNSIFEELPEIEANLFSVQGIKNYLMMFYKMPLVTMAVTMMALAWQQWQKTATEIAFQGFLSVGILFIIVLLFSNNKAVNIYKETKKTRIEITDKKIEHVTSNGELTIKLSQHHFKMDHLTRNVSMLRKIVDNEIKYIIAISNDSQITSNISMFKTIIQASMEKITTYVDMIDANANSAYLPLADILDKMTTGEIAAIPDPMNIVRNQTKERLKSIEREILPDDKSTKPEPVPATETETA